MNVLTTSDARKSLSQTLAMFREHGDHAEPLVFGDHRRPEAVVIPYSLYRALEQAFEQARFDAAKHLHESIEHAIAHPADLVKVERRRPR